MINEYYAELERALKKGSIDFSKLHLDDSVKVAEMSEMPFTGRKEGEEKRKQFVEMMSHFEIKKQYFDEESASNDSMGGEISPP